jgi:cupin superfamily acireductone dioxygenase involved in methionine salvage
MIEMDWISVNSEEVPKDTDVLIFTEHGGKTVAYWNEEYQVFAVECMEDKLVPVNGEITHWCHLIEDPKEEQ